MGSPGVDEVRVVRIGLAVNCLLAPLFVESVYESIESLVVTLFQLILGHRHLLESEGQGNSDAYAQYRKTADDGRQPNNFTQLDPHDLGPVSKPTPSPHQGPALRSGGDTPALGKL